MFKQFLVFIFFFAHIVLFGQSSDLDQKLKAQQEQEKLEKQSAEVSNLSATPTKTTAEVVIPGNTPTKTTPDSIIPPPNKVCLEKVSSRKNQAPTIENNGKVNK